MPIKSYKMKDGTLTIGETGSPVDFTSQVTKCVVKWSVDEDDTVVVLSGEELPGEETHTAVLQATVLQDLSDDGLVDYSWANKGAQVPFSFVPASAAARSISGMVKVRPIDVGGDVNKRPTSDIEWPCVGEPVLGADLT
jgi:hypothetical protein